MNKKIAIGTHTIHKESPAFIIAEMSGNHNQDFSRAVEIIHAAREAGADCIKLQTYTPDSLSLDCDSPYFVEKDSIWEGMTSYQLYEQAHTPWEWQPRLMEEAAKIGLECFSSPFDFASVDFMEEMKMPAYKIASYEINDIPLIRKIARLKKPVILSTGIAYLKDIERAVEVCREEGNQDVILLKCVSSYPAPYDTIHLRSMVTLGQTFDCLTGLSDHTMGSVVTAGAVTLGASVIEKHLTLRREDGGPDSAFSMEPEEFAEMVKNVRMLEKALGQPEYRLTEVQKREHACSRSLFAVQDIKAGEPLTPENIRSIRPHAGLHTMYYEEILNKTAAKDIKRGTPLEWSMIL